MSFKRLLMGAFSWAERAAAALFVMALAAAAVLYFGKMLSREHVQDAWSILCGEKVVVSPDDRKRIADLDSKAAAKSDIEKEEELGAEELHKKNLERRARLDDRIGIERNFMKDFEKQVEERENRVRAEAQKLADGQKQLADARKLFEDEKDRTHLSKVLKLYQGMDAEIVAADFEERLRGGKDQARNEIVEILRLMPERQASEVLSAIQKPETRNDLMEALRGTGGGPGASVSGKGGQAMTTGGGG